MPLQAHQAFMERYREIHAPFTRYCQSKAYGWIETEDLMQEVILAGLEGFERLKDKNKLFGYLVGIANNLIKQKAKLAKRRGEWDQKVLEKLESNDLTPEIALDVQFLLKAMDRLPDRQKEAILLFEVSGLSVREIAELQESQEGAIKTRLSRGRKKLREMMEEQPKKPKLAEVMGVFIGLL